MNQFLRFGVVGAIGFAVDVAVLHAALSLGAGLYLGRAISFLHAATATWLLNRLYTFPSTAPARPVVQWLRFVVAMIAGAAVNYGVYAGCVTFADACSRYPAIGVALGSLTGLALNFATARHFVFRNSSAALSAER